MKEKIISVCVLLWVFCATFSYAAERALRGAYPAPVAVYLPLWAAKETGIFKRRNIPTEIVSIGSSPIALSSLLAGEIDFLVGGGLTGISAYLQGYRDLKLFASINNRFVFAVYAHASIANVSALRGKRFGVTRFGGQLDFATRYFLKRSGLDPVKDVSLIQINRVPDILAALTAGSIDAGTLAIPYNFQAKKLGFRELADLTQIQARYAGAAFISKKQFLLEHRTRIQAFIKGLMEGIHFVKSHRQESLRILSLYTRVSDLGSLESAYDFHVKNIWPQAPAIHYEDLELIIEQLAEGNPRARNITPSDLIDSQLVKEIVDAGFLRELYK